jgi:hypothetical protein
MIIIDNYSKTNLSIKNRSPFLNFLFDFYLNKNMFVLKLLEFLYFKVIISDIKTI